MINRGLKTPKDVKESGHCISDPLHVARRVLFALKDQTFGVFSPELYILYFVSSLFGLAAAPVSGERFASDAVILVILAALQVYDSFRPWCLCTVRHFRLCLAYGTG